MAPDVCLTFVAAQARSNYNISRIFLFAAGMRLLATVTDAKNNNENF